MISWELDPSVLTPDGASLFYYGLGRWRSGYVSSDGRSWIRWNLATEREKVAQILAGSSHIITSHPAFLTST